MKFGIHRIDITPDYKTVMAGYASRSDGHDSVADPVTFTSLILVEHGVKIFIGTVDLLNLGHEQSKVLRRNIAKAINTKFSNVMINCSHTHGSFSVKMPDSMEGEHNRLLVEKNIKMLEGKVIKSVKCANKNLKEGQMFYGEGKTSIPMNRRTMVKGEILNRSNPKGEIDGALKLLKIVNNKGQIKAVLARVSAHPVATGAKHIITADFPGAFRQVCEKYFPDATAMFLQGVGADARPSHVQGEKGWKVIDHSELPVIGEHMFREVLKVLVNEMEALGELDFKSSIKVVNLPIVNKNVNLADLEKEYKINAPYKAHRLVLSKIIKTIKDGKKPRSSLPVTIQMIRFNKKFSILGVEGEVLCGLGKKIGNKLTTKHEMVLGYTNGADCYLPDKKEYKKGGYEVSSHVFHLLPLPLSSDMENIIVGTASEFDKELS